MEEPLRGCKVFLRFRSWHAAWIAVACLSAPPAFAVPTTVTSSDTPLCDVLVVPSQVDELGSGLPLVWPNETIGALAGLLPPPKACPLSPLIGTNERVFITNFTSTVTARRSPS